MEILKYLDVLIGLAVVMLLLEPPGIRLYASDCLA